MLGIKSRALYIMITQSSTESHPNLKGLSLLSLFVIIIVVVVVRQGPLCCLNKPEIYCFSLLSARTTSQHHHANHAYFLVHPKCTLAIV